MFFLEPEPCLREIDIHFAKLMKELSDGDEIVFLSACLVSRAVGDGHVCLDLRQLSGKEFTFSLRNNSKKYTIQCPELHIWYESLLKSKVVGRPGEYKPLILDDKYRLYLQRYWDYERILGEELLKKASKKEKIQDFSFIKDILFRLFPTEKGKINLQLLSAITALRRKLCVITGGPGTGKTTLIGKILALLIISSKREPKILLCAPTGKASARLKQAISEVKERIEVDEKIKSIIPDEAYTVHRMLKPIPKTPYFFYNSQNRLPADIVVVDEVSMVDLPLMSKLIQAIPEDAKLILLGDKNQLSSVEPGSVLGDICAYSTGISKDSLEIYFRLTGERFLAPFSGDHKIDECIVELKENYRFSKRSGIAHLSEAVNRGEKEKAMVILNSNFPDVVFRRLPSQERLKYMLKEKVLSGYKEYLLEKDPYNALKKFEKFRILSPIRWGPYGVNSINRIVEQILREEGLISEENQWYAGRPILITKNDYELLLFNGDTGIIMKDPERGFEERAFFIGADGTLRRFLPIRLPEHETAFSMTVHKAQGSEFDEVLFILPDTYIPIITRELIYTAITRAKRRIEIWAKPEIFEKGIEQKIERSSGLRDMLWFN